MKVFIKSFFVSMAITLIMLLILSILLAKTDFKESNMKSGIIFITSSSILIGGFLIGKNKKSNGIMYGAIFGAIYMISLYLISSFANMNFAITISAALMILFGIIGGVIGGILGVNC